MIPNTGIIPVAGRHELLQSCLNRMAEWKDTWGMSCNVSKCKVMHIGEQNPGYEKSMGCA